ncbi:MAG: hypothetical protein K9K35_12230 [Rhodoferax sp.]|nr:hypothetical protein [Rhodoferax sp.]
MPKVTECQAGVIRRGHDATATVVLQWKMPKGLLGQRRILFVGGAPKAADVPQTMAFTRDAGGWRVLFEGEEFFHIAEPLVIGG